MNVIKCGSNDCFNGMYKCMCNSMNDYGSMNGVYQVYCNVLWIDGIYQLQILNIGDEQ